MARAVPVFETDPAVYGSSTLYPGGWAQTGWQATLRFQRVVQIQVFPLRWSPTGAGRWAKRLTVEVTWDRKGEGDVRSLAPEEELWEGMYRRLVVNHESSKTWRRSPVPFAGFKDSQQREDEHKLIIDETGLYEIRYEDLPALDLMVPVGDLGVYRKVYDSEGSMPWNEVPVPIHLMDEDDDGFFGPGDRFYLWALDFRDAFVEYGFEDRYSWENVYWVGAGISGGARMDTASLWQGAVAGTLRTFPEVLHFEEEVYYWGQPAGSDRDGVPPECDVEQWFWTDWRTHSDTLSIAVHDAVPSSIPQIRARFQGNQLGTHVFYLSVFSGSGGAVGPDSISFSNQAQYVYESDTLIPAGFLAEGENFLEYEGWWIVGTDRGQRPGAFLDWIEIGYERILRARDDYLEFGAGENEGPWQIEIDGYTTDAVHIFDVSEPGNERWVPTPPEAVIPGESGYRVVFPDSLVPGRRWVAVAEGGARRLDEEEIEIHDPAAIYDAEADYIIIAHPLFVDGIQPLALHREAQGFRVQTVTVSEIYDEFSGGIKDPSAIKRYLQWGFERWTTKPQFVLLVGDASEDHLGVYAQSAPDFVPSISSCSQDELAGMDTWYVRFDEDLLLDMYLGRLPVGSDAELDAVVEKILAYEQFSAEDEWRGRVLLVSDDQCSGFNPYTCGRATEEIFEDATRATAEVVEMSPGSALEVQEIYLSDFTGRTLDEGFHAGCLDVEPEQAFLACLKDSVRARVTPMVFDALNDGVLLFSFQGHGHPNFLFDEHLLADSVTVTTSRWRSDLTDFLANDGRPFFVQGYGCHFGDFNQVEEADPSVQDCLLEKMLFHPGGGAIAALGSTALENLSASAAYQEFLHRAFFEDPPDVVKDTGSGRARWLLGEIQAAAIASLASSQHSGTFLTRYVLLGDPALRMDALPPAMEATVDGIPVETGAVIAAGDSSAAMIRVRIGDEVAVDSTTISVAIQESDAQTVLSLGVDYRVVRDTTITDGRVLFVEYLHPVELGNYDLLFGAQDRTGLPVSFSLKVRFSYRAWFDGRPAVSGSRVRPDADGLLEVDLPRQVSEEDFALRLDGPTGVLSIPAQAEALDETGLTWRLAFSLEDLNPGRYDLVLTAASLDGSVMSVEVADRLTIDQITAYPSPFEETTGFSFVLSRAATVRIRVFTVAGRLINTLEPDGVPDYNYIPWDGRDEDSENIANGVYLYQITARSGEEVVTSDIGKIVKMK
jgi:hypothetical protein